MSQRPAGRRSNASADPDDAAASPVELLFDLVFVFAVSQLSEHLLETLTWRGALETAVLLFAVFRVWASVSFGASFPGISRRRETIALFAVLILGVFFNAGLTDAFGDEPWLFLIPYLVASVGVVVFYMTARAAELQSHGQAMLVWTTAVTILWIVGGLVSSDQRLWWWLAAAALDTTGSWSAHRLPGRRFHTGSISFDAAHMIERSRLFLLIAIGETILTTGTALSVAKIDGPTILAAVLAVLGIVALWALYFGGPDRLIAQHASTAGDQLRAARLAINGLVITAAGLIAVAVGYELVIEHPLQQAGWAIALLLTVGPLLYITLQAWYLRALTGRLSRSRVVAGAVLLVCAPFTWALPAIFTLTLSSAVVTALAVRVAVRARRDSRWGTPATVSGTKPGSR